MIQPHIITVTVSATEEDYDTEFSVECPGTCSFWIECGCDHTPTADEDDEGEFTAHGKVHERIEGYWTVPGAGCVLSVLDSAAEALQDAVYGLAVGTHEVFVEYEGDGDWSIVPKKVSA